MATGYAFYKYRINRLRIRRQLIRQREETRHLRAMDEMKMRFFPILRTNFVRLYRLLSLRSNRSAGTKKRPCPSVRRPRASRITRRTEEHTSETQSLMRNYY